MSDPQYLRMQADSLEAKGDRLFDLNRTVEAQQLYDEAEALRKQAADLEIAKEPKIQGRLFESYAGLPDEDQFEDEDNPFVTCDGCGFAQPMPEATHSFCMKCGMVWCPKCNPDWNIDRISSANSSINSWWIMDMDDCHHCRGKDVRHRREM